MGKQAVMDYIESTASHCRDELVARLKEVEDIHHQYAACHTGASNRVGRNLAAVARSAYEWLGDKRQHPKSFAVWAAENPNRETVVLVACAHVNGSTSGNVQSLYD